MRNTKSGDMCVVYDVRFGFIVLEYYMDGYFENNSNYDNTEDLYQHLWINGNSAGLWIRQRSTGQKNLKIMNRH